MTDSDETRGFCLKREAPWMLIPMLVSAAIRYPVTKYAVNISHGDTGIVALMMRRWWTGEDRPLIYYGQKYMGALDPIMAAPFYGMLGPESGFRALSVAQLVIFALLAIPLAYALFHRVGGRWGAVCATTLMAVGTPWLIICTTGRYTGYLSTIWLGSLLLLLGLRWLEEMTLRRLAILGFLTGLGWYNNPQIALFVAPLVIATWARGRTFRLWSQGRLGEALGPRQSIVARLVLVVLLVAMVAVVAECLKYGVEQHRPDDRGFRGFQFALFSIPIKISLGSPESYLPRLIIGLGALLGLLELRLAEDRKRWLKFAATFGALFAIGAAPWFIATKVQGTWGRSAPLDINPAWVVKRVDELRFARLTILGDGNVERAAMSPEWLKKSAHADNLRTAAIMVWVAILLAVVVRQLGEIGRLLMLRPTKVGLLTLLLMLQTIQLTLYLQHPSWAGGRYFVFSWLLLGASLAWTVGWIRRKHWSLPILLMIVLLGHYGLVYKAWITETINPAVRHRTPDERELVAELERRKLTHGVADYVLTYHIMVLSDERVTATCRDLVWERLPENRDRVLKHGPDRIFHLMATWVPSDPEDARWFEGQDWFRARWRKVDYWQVGRYKVTEFVRRK